MGKIIDKIIDTDNLHWAWKKVKNNFKVGDIWYDEIELASFEADLYTNLEVIKSSIISNSYTLNTIKPLPFPKGCDKNGGVRVRQTFEISVRDQVVWMAVVNVVGNHLDYLMPWWSYGHRLYVPVWKDLNERWEMGWYTHSKGILYRKWNQSWPLFRRNISLTAKIMCCNKKSENSEKTIYEIEVDDAERNIYLDNEILPEQFKSKYLTRGYWGDKGANTLYWGTIDFSKFYPKVKRNVIVDNIISFTKDASLDAEFKSLLNNLMNFQIDDSNWSIDELAKNSGIDLDPQCFNGIPTGLFVAGFLANVALLKVDFRISDYLDRNRDIAHFRFVDDHVILAYDFKKLQDWMKLYKQYLDEENVGAEFNYEKVEPKSLSNIINNEWFASKKADEQNKEVEQAKKDSTLDPNFPAPLMKKTLAKVSAINNSDFEFLTKNEEDQLLSDIEHLLLTDFPDHELRKDTRVSFAASVLSRILPDTKVDYTMVYESRKKIHHLIKEFSIQDRVSKKKFVTHKLHELLFNIPPNIDEYFLKWKSEVKDLNNSIIKSELIDKIKQEKESEILHIKQIESQILNKKNRVFKLLIKAIKENPEKVRIWSRVLDYCRKVSHCNVNDVYRCIYELEQDKIIHFLSANFLNTLFINVLSEKIIKSVYLIINNRGLSDNEAKITRCFLESSFNNELLDRIFNVNEVDNKTYYLKSYEFLRFVLGSTIYILEDTVFSVNLGKEKIEKYNLIDWSLNPVEWIKSTHSKDINSWLYWLLLKTHDNTSSRPHNYWRKLQVHIDFSSPTFKPLILPFPKYCYLPENNFDVIDVIFESGFDEGWLFELIMSSNQEFNLKITNEVLSNHIKEVYSTSNGFISLWEFINWQWKKLNVSKDETELEIFNKYFSPSFSEWTALEIVSQIIDELTSIDDFFNSAPENKIHPSNIKVSKKLINNNSNSWDEWKNLIRENKIKFIDSSLQISDERYTTNHLKKMDQKEGENSMVHALGVIMLQLIVHSKDLPWIWNSTDKSLVWENLYLKKIQYASVSSYTLLILRGCFSSVNRERQQTKVDYTMNKFKFDTTNAVPAIYDLNTLKNFILVTQNNLEKFQLSMENNIPRQLIPINLMQLSVQNNPFVNSESHL